MNAARKEVRKRRSPKLIRLIFDGSQDWVIAHNDVVAGSSPAFGTTRRSSSVVEHVFPVRLLSVVTSHASIPKGRDVLERICGIVQAFAEIEQMKLPPIPQPLRRISSLLEEFSAPSIA